MPNEPRNRTPTEDRPYRVYRSDSPDPQDDSPREDRGRRAPDRSGRARDRPAYTVYRSAPRSLLSRLRAEDDVSIEQDQRDGGGGRPPLTLPRPGWRGRITPRRVIAGIAAAIVAWLLLSLVLFLISAQQQSGTIPAAAKAALASGPNMLTSTDTVLILGTDQRPKGSKEPGADTSDKGSRSDTIMLWRIGGGTSRRLSIPRDTLTTIPGYGKQKINAAYAFGGPALAIKTIEAFTGIPINHVIIVNLANFPKFIDAIGGVDVKTGRICSNISGGVKKGGFSLFLAPGVHHLTGIQALTLARTRDNACDAASTDLTREAYQQKILNSIKSRLLSPSIVFHLPWAAYDAPQAVRTDMGGFTLMSLFVAAELGGSAPTAILTPTGGEDVPGVGDSLIASPQDVKQAVAKLMNG
jgi:LCP family protein required for cell wall assembly